MTTNESLTRCLNCGFTAPSGGEEWNAVEVPSLGTLSQCPDCRSTDLLAPR